eukprot:g15881.t1
MGLCLSEPTDDWLDGSTHPNQRKPVFFNRSLEGNAHEDMVTVLLVGAADSGKSTLFKQLQCLYGGQEVFDAKKRAPYKPMVYVDTILSMKTLVRQSHLLGEKIPEAHWRKLSADSASWLEGLDDVSSLSAETARHIKLLWADSGIKKTYEMRTEFKLMDECAWFFNRVDEIARQDYIPSFGDILRLRSNTRGFSEAVFRDPSAGNGFRIWDVGGNRNERKKWYHRFEQVSAILFVAAINEYDQILSPGSSRTALHDALSLFEEICNSRWFARKTIILFLNKKDLFQEKILKTDLSCFMEEYTGGHDFLAAVDFLRQQFESRNEHPTKKIYTHLINCTDTEDVRLTFKSVRQCILAHDASAKRLYSNV